MATKEEARKELARRELERRKDQVKASAEVKKREILSKDKTAERFVSTDEKIANRGELVKNAMSNLQSESVPRKIMGTLQAASVPFQSIESGIANAMLSVQKGGDIKQVIKEAGAGFALKSQGEFGDIFRNVGASDPVAASLGLSLGIGVPTKVLSGMARSLRDVARMSDKGMRKAGQSLVKATDAAIEFSGKRLNKMFDGLKDKPVQASKLDDAFAELPDALVREMERQLGNLDVFMSNFNVAKLRRIKQFVGKFRPSAFGKSDKGLTEGIADRRINKGYAILKKTLEESVEASTNKKVAKALLAAEDNFSEVARSADFIKRTVVDPTLRKPTKGGSAASKLVKEGDLGFRESVNVLRGSGKVAKKEVMRAVDRLESFNRAQAAFQFLQHSTNAAIFGGIAGSIGARIFQSTVDNR